MANEKCEWELEKENGIYTGKLKCKNCKTRISRHDKHIGLNSSLCPAAKQERPKIPRVVKAVAKYASLSQFSWCERIEDCLEHIYADLDELKKRDC